MKQGYSKLLVNELAIGSAHVSPYATSSDLTMADVLSARKRSDEDWKALLGPEGFETVKVWQGPAASEAVIDLVVLA